MPSRSLRLDAYVVDVLLPDLVGHDRHPSAFLVYLHLWRRSAGSRRRAEPASLRSIADATGLSKRSVQAALATLARRRLVALTRVSPTAVPVIAVLRPWERRKTL